MGNSTRTLQSVVDAVSTIGDLNPVLTNTGGFAAEPANTIASAAMNDLIAKRFNWKWNRILIPGFPLTSNQQDYASVGIRNIGWLESASVQDVNNTSFPKPTLPVATERDLTSSSYQGGLAGMVAWEQNAVLETGVWPGPGSVYSNPVGSIITPTNPLTNILDVNGALLILTTYGTTGLIAPVAPAPIAPATTNYGMTVADGSCVWTVGDPGAQGFRVTPRPPQAGNVWLMRVVAQAKAVRFTSLAQTLDPIPDDYSTWFEDGFIAYAHRHSSNPQVKAKYPQMKAEWLQAMTLAVKQGNREAQPFGFVPERTVMDSNAGYGLTAAWPYPGTRRY